MKCFDLGYDFMSHSKVSILYFVLIGVEFFNSLMQGGDYGVDAVYIFPDVARWKVFLCGVKNIR